MLQQVVHVARHGVFAQRRFKIRQRQEKQRARFPLLRAVLNGAALGGEPADEIVARVIAAQQQYVGPNALQLPHDRADLAHGIQRREVNVAHEHDRHAVEGSRQVPQGQLHTAQADHAALNGHRDHQRRREQAEEFEKRPAKAARPALLFL